MRLTPSFTAKPARELLLQVVDEIGRGRASYLLPNPSPQGVGTTVEFQESWSAYSLPDDSRIVRALETAARQHRLRPKRQVVGPSNIGNYLASLGIEATAGFGVDYKNLHRPDECIDLSTIPLVLDIYEAAIRDLLSPDY